jgi:hypothetical protein
MTDSKAAASPAPEPVAFVKRGHKLAHVVLYDQSLPEGTKLYTAPPADERVSAFSQRAESAEYDLQILTTVVRTGFHPPRSIPMRESAETAARISVEKAERVARLEELLQEADKSLSAWHNFYGSWCNGPRMENALPPAGNVDLQERIRAALNGG